MRRRRKAEKERRIYSEKENICCREEERRRRKWRKIFEEGKYLVNRGWYWLLLGGTGSVEGGTGWNLVVLGQNRAVLLSENIWFT